MGLWPKSVQSADADSGGPPQDTVTTYEAGLQQQPQLLLENLLPHHRGNSSRYPLAASIIAEPDELGKSPYSYTTAWPFPFDPGG